MQNVGAHDMRPPSEAEVVLLMYHQSGPDLGHRSPAQSNWGGVTTALYALSDWLLSFLDIRDQATSN